MEFMYSDQELLKYLKETLKEAEKWAEKEIIKNKKTLEGFSNEKLEYFKENFIKNYYETAIEKVTKELQHREDIRKRVEKNNKNLALP